MIKLTRTQVAEWRSKFQHDDLKFAQFCFQQGVITTYERLMEDFIPQCQQAFLYQKAHQTPADKNGQDTATYPTGMSEASARTSFEPQLAGPGIHSRPENAEASFLNFPGTPSGATPPTQQTKPQQGVVYPHLHCDAFSHEAFRDVDKPADFLKTKAKQDIPELQGRSDEGHRPVRRP